MSADGAIIRWKMPEKAVNLEQQLEQVQITSQETNETHSHINNGTLQVES